MQNEGTKLMFVMNFTVLDFFKFASRMPQIAQILKFSEGGWGREACPRTPLEISSFFCSLTFSGSVFHF